MKVIDSARYVDAIRYYLTMPKDIGFDYMESVVDEIMDMEEITWTEAYEYFGSLCDRVIMEDR
jgi:hypothetical protein